MPATMSTFGCASKVNNSTASFWVRVNCGMYERTIETALKATESAGFAVYALEAHIFPVLNDSNTIGLRGSSAHALARVAG
jgi:hypothetical protein